MALSLRSSALALSTVLMLTACGSKSEQSAQATPDGAVLQWVAALKKDDLGALLQSEACDPGDHEFEGDEDELCG